jgi:NAD(P)-dependent dehydrogenase (short-subunit alcohol dehydrogenase family)
MMMMVRIRRLATEVLARYPKLNVLVNNAGAMHRNTPADEGRHRIDPSTTWRRFCAAPTEKGGQQLANPRRGKAAR